MAAISIRLRLTAWYFAILSLGLVLFATALWLALEHRLMSGADARLAHRIEGLETVLKVEGDIGTARQLQTELAEYAEEIPEGGLIQMSDANRELVLPVSGRPLYPPELASVHPVYKTVGRDGGLLRILTSRIQFRGQTYDVAAGSSLDDVASVMGDLRNLLLWIMPAVLAVACAGGWWIGRRALAPVDRITQAARSIGVHNLAQRLDVSQTGDELQRMSETWNEVLDRLDNSVKRIRQFTADASHELRTPLALVRGTAELALRHERSPEEYRKSLTEIQNEAEQMTGLTEALLAIARWDAKGTEMILSPTDLGAIVQAVARLYAPMAAAKSIRLIAKPANEPLIASANEPALHRLLCALVDNALKYTQEEGSVTISAAPVDGSIRLAVADTGIGIAPEALPHIFERFFRADQVRGSGSGTGLGLSIAQAIAKAHGTEITVQSTPDKGSHFDLVLSATGFDPALNGGRHGETL